MVTGATICRMRARALAFRKPDVRLPERQAEVVAEYPHRARQGTGLEVATVDNVAAIP
jgi:hypothetical protein